jgi:hypothetical protein
MKTIFGLLIALALATPASAQQPQQSFNDVAVSITSNVNAMALAATQQANVLTSVKAQLAEKDARIKELEDKYEPKPK